MDSPQSADSAQEPQRTSTRRWAIAAIVIPVGVLATAAYFFHRERQAEFARAEHERNLRAVAVAKSGRGDVSISNAELLVMLVEDPECVENISTVYFFMTDLKDPRFERLAELRNMKQIGFYDCRNADSVLMAANEMDTVNEVVFEVTNVSDKAIKTLAELPNLQKIRFEQIVSDETVEQLEDLLPDVTLEIPYPASQAR